MRLYMGPTADNRDFGWLDEDVVELSLLLTARQLGALEEAASGQGMSAGQLLRSLTQEYLHGLGLSPPGRLPATPTGTSGVSPEGHRSARIGAWRPR
jgi:hypothetical protein